MSLFPAFISARKRQDDPAPARETDSEPQAGALAADGARDETGDNIFSLLPPAQNDAEAVAPPPPKPQGRNRHPVDMTDLSRLSIDRDGRLYWDGKPVEVHRRIAMSRPQIVGASIVAAFVVIGAIGAALQGTLAARELMCRLSWSADACAAPAPPRANIPT
jgi:hypothetical protein